MSHALRGWSRLALLTIVAALVTTTQVAPVAAVAPVAQTTAPVNDDGTFVQMYSANMESLAAHCGEKGWTDKDEWKELIDYMVGGPPDIFVVEQINDKQLTRLVSYMTRHLGDPYEGRMAKQHPKRIGDPKCKAKTHQGNAIIWRTGRFTALASVPWQSKTWQKSKKHKHGSCRTSTQDRTVNRVIKFDDSQSNNDVTVTSMHWPTHKLHGWRCATNNIQRARAAVGSLGHRDDDLLVLGGDTNIKDSYPSHATRPWYRADRGGLSTYKDAIYDMCTRPDNGPVRTCLRKNLTFGRDLPTRRYDFIFAREGDGGQPQIELAHTITFLEADGADGTSASLRYSEHLAIRADVYYPDEVVAT